MSNLIEKKDIRDLSVSELEQFMTMNNEKAFRGRQVFEWIWKNAARDFDMMTNLSKSLREKLRNDLHMLPLMPEEEHKSEDQTVKYLFSTHEGYHVEGVLIPTGNKLTACISSQVGCNLRCTFCATGKIIFKRNLTAGEIFDQVSYINQAAQEKYNKRLSNIVLMGMGEPLLNHTNVMMALERISSPEGFEFSPRRITLSTAGITRIIKKIADIGFPYELAISLHTADDEKRNMIMPLNRTNPLKDLAASLKYFHSKTGTRITYEYLLLKDFNDSPEDAATLALFCRITPCKVNLIEYNEVPGSPFKRSERTKVNRFKEFLESKNMIVNLRKSRGEDIAAACGQLAGGKISD